MQCLDGMVYDDFQFGGPVIEQKELLMETGKDHKRSLCLGDTRLWVIVSGGWESSFGICMCVLTFFH